MEKALTIFMTKVDEPVNKPKNKKSGKNKDNNSDNQDDGNFDMKDDNVKNPKRVNCFYL